MNLPLAFQGGGGLRDVSHKGDGLNSQVYCSVFKKGYRLMEFNALLSSA